jgi:probable rRNA maturation factor
MPDPDHTQLVVRTKAALPRRRLLSFARTLSAEVAAGRSFTILLTGDADLRAWNRQFLGHDYPTDVLSFPQESPNQSVGEIAISVDRAAEQAAGHGHSLEAEIQVLMLHGVLHLIGMDHERDSGQMKRAERKWRRAFGLGEGLIERAARGPRRQSRASARTTSRAGGGRRP